MKVICGLLMFVTMGILANGQNAGAKVIAEISASSERVVKGSPFSAEAVSESVQVLADGNRIVRSSTSKLFRNSEGRFRREGSGGIGGVLGSHFELGASTVILDPVLGQRYYLDQDSKTARSVVLRFAPVAQVSGNYNVVTAAKIANAEKIHVELTAAQASGTGTTVVGSPAEVERLVTVARAAQAGGTGTGSTAFAAGFAAGMQNSKTEQLGVQNIEGVDAEGTRSITTIEAGKIGNERAIEIVYERWYSKDLQLVIMSKHSDPRFGEQTYRLTNITRSEPDPSLFALPNGYKLTTEPSGVHKLVGGEGQNVYTIKAPSATSVKSTKP